MPAQRLLKSLPAIFGEDAFLGQFLQPFEEIMLGPSPNGPAIEEFINELATYFDPQQAPTEFLTTLSSWVALTLRADLSEAQFRNFIGQAVPLYRMRGTKAGLEQLLLMYTGLAPTITELAGSDFQIGVHSTLGEDTLLGGGGPHFFRVTIRIAQPDPALRAKYLDIATAIIEGEKPAHTNYQLFVETPSMQIGVHSTVGVDTALSIPI